MKRCTCRDVVICECLAGRSCRQSDDKELRALALHLGEEFGPSLGSAAPPAADAVPDGDVTRLELGDEVAQYQALIESHAVAARHFHPQPDGMGRIRCRRK